MGKKISQLAVATGANLTDLLEKTNDPNGSPVSQQMTLQQVQDLLVPGGIYLASNPQGFAQSGQFVSGISITGGASLRGAFYINQGTNIVLTQQANSGFIIETVPNLFTGIGLTNYIPKFSSTSGFTTGNIYDNNAKIGINTTNPQHRLDVSGNIAASGIYLTNSRITATGNNLYINQQQLYPSSNPSGFLTSGNSNYSSIQPTISGNTATLTGLVIDWSQSSSFYYELTAKAKVTFTGQKDGQTIVVVLNSLNGYTNSSQVLWPAGKLNVNELIDSGIYWPNNIYPDQTSGAMDVYSFSNVAHKVFGVRVSNYTGFVIPNYA